MKKTLFWSLVLIFCLVCQPSFSNEPVYPIQKEKISINACNYSKFNIIDLGYVDNNNQNTNAVHLNILGNSIGNYSLPNGLQHAFYFSDGEGIKDTHPDLKKGNQSYANSINDRNHVVGDVFSFEGDSVTGYWYDQHSFQIIETVKTPGFLTVKDINNNDQVLINKFTTNNGGALYPQTFVWQNGHIIFDINLYGRKFVSLAMNDNKIIAGVIDYDSIEKGFVWNNGQLTILPSLEGDMTQAKNLNNNGIIVGYSEKKVEPYHRVSRPVYWIKSSLGEYALKDILVSNTDGGSANAINSQGIIVGVVSLFNMMDRYPFLFNIRTNELIDLRTRVNDLGGRVLLGADDLNDRCQILVNGYDSHGHPSSFRLDPI